MLTKHQVFTTEFAKTDSECIQALSNYLRKKILNYYFAIRNEKLFCIFFFPKGERKGNLCNRLFAIKGTNFTPQDKIDIRASTKAENNWKGMINEHDNVIMNKIPACIGSGYENRKNHKQISNASKRPGISWQRKFELLMRQECKCNKCGTLLSLNNYDSDHVIPWYISFDNSDSNLQILCLICHRTKTKKEHKERLTKTN